MLRSIPPKKSVPSRRRRFIGEQLGQNSKKSEDPEKDLNDFKKKLKERAKRKEW